MTEPIVVIDKRPPLRLANFQITKQHRRFVEFADAVRRHRYIGLSPKRSGAGAGAHSIMRQTWYRDPKMLEVYAREHAPLVGNAVTRLEL